MNARIKIEMPATQYNMITAEDVMKQPLPKWLVRGILPERGIAAVYGAPSSGKTFLTLNLALAVCDGVPWLGNLTEPRPVVYVSLEGTLGSRIKAAKTQLRKFPDDFRVIERQRFHMGDDANIEGIIKSVEQLAGKGGAMVIIDTWARSTTGITESSNDEMGVAIEAAGRIVDETNSLVLIVHHSGKNEDAGMRGASALLGAMDSVLRVSLGNPRSVKVEKNKEGEDGQIFHFDLHPVEIGQDERGHTVKSCVVREASAAVARTRALGANQAKMMEAITEVLSEMPETAPDKPKSITVAQAKEVWKARGGAPKQFGEVAIPLLAHGKLKSDGPPSKGTPSQPTLGKTIWLP